MARVVLGNHDLHLLAIALVPARTPRRSDTLDDVLAAPDREKLLAGCSSCRWFTTSRRAAICWCTPACCPVERSGCSGLGGGTLRRAKARTVALLTHMYGDQPDLWDARLTGMERWR